MNNRWEKVETFRAKSLPNALRGKPLYSISFASLRKNFTLHRALSQKTHRKFRHAS